MRVHGIAIDDQTRCAHFHSERDVVAIKFHCCGEWFSCRECHDELTEHQPSVWPREQFNERAILCGVCGMQLAISDYLDCVSTCPHCGASFNPACANHHGLYFAAAR